MSEEPFLFAPELGHVQQLRDAPTQLAFDPAADFDDWRMCLRAKLRELLGMNKFRKVDANLRVLAESRGPEFRETRFVFTAETGVEVPCHLLIPAAAQGPVPLVVCLQGHSTGMHISLGRPKYPGDDETIKGGDRDYALRIVREGFAALVMEQRCFGERNDCRTKDIHPFHAGCTHASMVELLLGRTMIGARAWDVMRAIDAVDEMPGLDLEHIACMGNSGGGTVTWFAACLEPRIQVAMPSCYFCTWRQSIARIDHCVDNYIPGALQYFDLGDLAGLIAPRPLVIVAGEQDNIFPIDGVHEEYARVQAIYAKAGAAEKCHLVVGPGGHRFYADLAWPEFHRLAGWKRR
jgi:cephalosporin-C deacetylase-like acetyl esterase